MTDQHAIQTLIEEWAAAVRQRDIAAILRDHAQDMLMFDVPPPLESRGLAAYTATWDLFFRWARVPVKFDIQRLEITAGTDVAFATALMRCGSKDADLDFRLTIGLKKLDRGWTIVHEHHSVPAED